VPNFYWRPAVVLIIPGVLNITVVFAVAGVPAIAGVPANAGVLAVAYVLKCRYLEKKHIVLFSMDGSYLFWNPVIATT
jgi:hypothetical protein